MKSKKKIDQKLRKEMIRDPWKMEMDGEVMRKKLKNKWIKYDFILRKKIEIFAGVESVILGINIGFTNLDHSDPNKSL